MILDMPAKCILLAEGPWAVFECEFDRLQGRRGIVNAGIS